MGCAPETGAAENVVPLEVYLTKPTVVYPLSASPAPLGPADQTLHRIVTVELIGAIVA